MKSNVFLKWLSFGSKECTKELKQECANFLGLISYHLIVSKFHNKTHDPKGQENKSLNTFLSVERLARRPTPISVHYFTFLYPPQTLFVGGILFSRCPCVRPSVTLCFLNNSKSHCWIFIKPCKHVHICKANTLDKKVRARGQFY